MGIQKGLTSPFQDEFEKVSTRTEALAWFLRRGAWDPLLFCGAQNHLDVGATVDIAVPGAFF